MCRHSSILTVETCSICSEEKTEQDARFQPLSAPIYEGMTQLDKEAARIGHLYGSRSICTKEVGRGGRPHQHGKGIKRGRRYSCTAL